MNKPVPVNAIYIHQPIKIPGGMIHEDLDDAGMQRRKLKAWVVPGGLYVESPNECALVSWSSLRGAGLVERVGPEVFCTPTTDIAPPPVQIKRGPGRPPKGAA